MTATSQRIVIPSLPLAPGFLARCLPWRMAFFAAFFLSLAGSPIQTLAFDAPEEAPAFNCAPPSTSNLGVDFNSATNLVLRCNNVSAVGYGWKYRLAGTSTWAEMPTTTVNSCAANNLLPNTHYEFQVKLSCSSGVWSNWSSSGHFITAGGSGCPAPIKEQCKVINITNKSARLQADMLGAIGFDWRCRASGSSAWEEMPNSTRNYCDLPVLKGNTKYEFQVKVCCPNGIWSDWCRSDEFWTSGESTVDCLAPLAAQLAATEIGETSLRLNTTVSGATSYEWHYKKKSGGDWVVAGTTTTNYCNLKGLFSNTLYEYKVRLCCVYGVYSSWSPIAECRTSGACDAPSLSQISATDITSTSARLNVSVNAYSYGWRIRKVGAANWSQVTSSVNNVLATGLQPGMEYEFQVCICCVKDHCSAWSYSKKFTTPSNTVCPKPTLEQIYASNIGNTTATLNASLTGLASYGWRFRRQGTAEWITLSSTATNSTNLVNLLSNTTYEFQVCVCCKPGDCSPWSDTETFTTTGACVAPTLSQISATEITKNSAKLNASINGVSTYGWRYRKVGDANWITLTSTAANNVVLTNLMAKTTYEFQVCICCAPGNCSAWSDSEKFTTLDDIVCTVPTIGQLFVSNVQATSVELNTSITGALSYHWQYRVLGSNTWISAGSTATNSKTLTGLTGNTTYEFQLYICCAKDVCCAWSDSKKFLTAPHKECSAPTLDQISASNITQTSARLNANISGAISYGWRYRLAGSNGNWTTITNGANNYVNIGYLTACTKYEFQVCICCEKDDCSAWSYTDYFTTECKKDCPAPTLEQIYANNITHTSARLNANVSGAISYGWRYRVAGSNGSWTTVANGGNNYVNIGYLAHCTKYEYQVCICCEKDDCSAWSYTDYFTTECKKDCPAPRLDQIGADYITTTGARLFANVSGAISYGWRYRVAGSNGAWITAPSGSANFVMINGLQSCTKYEFQVCICCDKDDCSLWSYTDYFTTDCKKECPAPTLEQIYVNNITANSARLNANVPDAYSYGWRYRVAGSGGSWISISNGANNYVNIHNLQACTRYEFQVCICCYKDDCSAWSYTDYFSTECKQVCPAPTLEQIYANNITVNSARLNASVQGAVSYGWRYRIAGSNNNWTTISNGNVNYVDIHSLATCTRYEFQVCICCDYSGTNCSAWSYTEYFTTECKTACPTPTLEQIYANNITLNSARLNASVPGAMSYGWRYRLAGSNNAWTTLNQTGSNNVTISNLLTCTRYEFQVCVCCDYSASNCSGWSYTEYFTTECKPHCPAPSTEDIYANNISQNSARLNATVGGAISYGWRYRVAGSNSAWLTAPSGNAPTVVIYNLLACTRYEFQVCICCDYAATNCSVWSYSDYFTTECKLICPTPTLEQISASNITLNSAQLNASVQGAMSYGWRYRLAGTNNTWTTLSQTGSNNVTIGNLAGCTRYEFQVCICCDYSASNCSNWSASEYFTTVCKTICLPPSAEHIGADYITASAARLYANASGAIAYGWRYRVAGSNNEWKQLSNTTANFVMINDLAACTRYEFQVCICCGKDDCSAWSVTIYFTTTCNICVPPTVDQLFASNITTTTAQLNASVSAYSYGWRYRAAGSGEWIQSASTANIAQLTNLLTNTTYEYQACICCTKENCTLWSASKYFTTGKNEVCAVVTANQLSVSELSTTSAQLNTSRGNVFSYIWRYRQVGTANWIVSGTTSSGNRVLTDLTQNTTYEFQVQVCCSKDFCSDWSVSHTFTTLTALVCNPPTVEQIFANNITNTTAQLNSTVINGAISYGWRYRQAGAQNWISLDGTTGNSKSLTGLTAGTTYEFQVCICCAPGKCSAWSVSMFFTTTHVIPCPTPTAQQLSASNITTNSAQFNTTATGISYEWRYRAMGAANWIPVVGTTNNFATIVGLIANTTYEFQVKVCCAKDVCTEFSVSIYFTTDKLPVCDAPKVEQATATNITTTSAQLNNSATGAISYGWRYRQVGAANWIVLPGTNTGTTSLAGLAPNTTYEFQVCICCSKDLCSPWSISVTFTTLKQVCVAPTVQQLSASNITTNIAQLNVAITGAATYSWRYRPAGTAQWIELPSTNVNSVVVNGLSPNTSYEFQVYVCCAPGNCSEWSPTGTFTTAKPFVCEAPTAKQLVASNLNNTGATLTINVGGVFAYYWRYRPASGNHAWIAIGGLKENALNITGLTPGIKYEWQAYVCCTKDDCSPWSASEYFETTGALCPAVHSSNITVSNITTTSASASAAVSEGTVSNWRYRTVGTSEWQSISNTTTVIALAGLLPGTQYELQIRILCKNGTYSDWSASVYFTTLTSTTCPAPTAYQVSASEITTNSARLNTSAPGAVSYGWRIRELGTANWINLSGTNANSTVASNLKPGTSYEFQVCICCTKDHCSAWSVSVIFKTLPDKPSPTACACTDFYAKEICENFESYNTGQPLGPQSACWTTWSGHEGGAEDGVITTQPDGADKTLRLSSNLHGGGPQDVVMQLGNRTTGAYELKFRMWVPHGREGYFNVLHQFTPGAGADIWALEVFFDNNGLAFLQTGGTRTHFTYPRSQWFNVYLYIDIQDNTTKMFVNGHLVREWPFCYAVSNTACVSKRLAALNFYPATGNSLFYVDDIKMTSYGENCMDIDDTNPGGVCPLIFAPVCGCNGVTYPNSCVAANSGVAYILDGPCAGNAQGDNTTERAAQPTTPTKPGEIATLRNAPNPFSDETMLTFTLTEAAEVSLFVTDLYGKRIADPIGKARQYEAGEHSVEFNAATLADGLYLAVLNANGQQVVKKMVVKKN